MSAKTNLTATEREEIIKTFHGALKRLKADFKYAKQVSISDYCKSELNQNSIFAAAVVQLEILVKWADKTDKRKNWYKFTAGEPTYVMASEVLDTYREIAHIKYLEKRKRAKEKAAKELKEAEAKQEALNEAEEVVEAAQEVVEEAAEETVEVAETPKVEASKEKVNAKNPAKDEMRVMMIDAALRIMDIGIDSSTLEKIVWAIDYVTEQKGKANLKEVIKYNVQKDTK